LKRAHSHVIKARILEKKGGGDDRSPIRKKKKEGTDPSLIPERKGGGKSVVQKLLQTDTPQDGPTGGKSTREKKKTFDVIWPWEARQGCGARKAAVFEKVGGKGAIMALLDFYG